MKIFSVKVKNQFDQIQYVNAKMDPFKLRSLKDQYIAHSIDYIEINGEIIKPSIELLFLIQNTNYIYKVLEA